jgi:membrane-bound acyltransferase YfiQ involved in biofilm formation
MLAHGCGKNINVHKESVMRWLILVLFVLLSAYLVYFAAYNAWASTTPVIDPEAFKTRFYVLIAGAFVTLGLGVNAFIMLGRNKR